MTTNAALDRIAELAGLMVESAVTALQDATGVPVAVDGVTVLDTVDASALTGASLARTMITGGAAPGGLVTVVPDGGVTLSDEKTLDASTLIDVLAAGAIEALRDGLDVPFQAAPGEALPADPASVGLGEHVLQFAIGTGASAPVPVLWVVEASLAALLSDGAPVTPPAAGPGVAPATLPELGGGVAFGQQQELHLLADVPMNVTVELGRALMQVRDLLSLQEGSIVELDRAAGAAVDVLVNGTLVARGDVVVVDDELGVRITEIVER